MKKIFFLIENNYEIVLTGRVVAFNCSPTAALISSSTLAAVLDLSAPAATGLILICSFLTSSSSESLSEEDQEDFLGWLKSAHGSLTASEGATVLKLSSSLCSGVGVSLRPRSSPSLPMSL